MIQLLLRLFSRRMIFDPPVALRAAVLLVAVLAYGTTGFLYFELPGNPDLEGAFRRLSEIGYAVPLRDELGMDMLARETATIDVITAFQRRYRPANITGVLDNETATILAAVDVAFAKARS